MLGLSEDEAKQRIYVRIYIHIACYADSPVPQTVDSKGLVTADRKGLQEHKKCQSIIFILTDIGTLCSILFI